MKKYIDAEAFMDALYSIDPENGSDGCTIIAQNMDYTSADLEAMVADTEIQLLHRFYRRYIKEKWKSIIRQCG